MYYDHIILGLSTLLLPLLKRVYLCAYLSFVKNDIATAHHTVKKTIVCDYEKISPVLVKMKVTTDAMEMQKEFYYLWPQVSLLFLIYYSHV